MSRVVSEATALAAKVAELDQKVRHLSERQEIIDVFRRYTRGLNRYDIELLKSAFWPDAQINYGVTSSLRDDWVSAWQRRYMEGRAGQAHHIINETVDIVGDVAHVESYLIAFWRTKDDKPAMIRAGRYVDRLDRRKSEWRIVVREFIPHFWVEVNSVFDSTITKELWPSAGYGVGTLDKSDPCYRRPLNPRPNKNARVG